jgi:hypothetical protein
MVRSIRRFSAVILAAVGWLAVATAAATLHLEACPITAAARQPTPMPPASGDRTPEPSTKAGDMALQQLLPDMLADWTRTGDDEFYDQKTIFKYMDGAGEVYLSFAFQRLLVRRYVQPGGAEVIVELYDMGNAADAFGIFSRNRQGKEAGIGQGSEARSGYLVFWRDRYFATVFAGTDDDGARNAVPVFGRAIADRIPGRGAVPVLVSWLPPGGLRDTSIRYFHKHTDLNEHYFIADDNILDLGPQTEAVIANYLAQPYEMYLLLIRYPTGQSADAAFTKYAEAFLPETDPVQGAQLEDGSWTAAERIGEVIVAIYDAPSAEQALELMSAAARRLQGEEP